MFRRVVGAAGLAVVLASLSAGVPLANAGTTHESFEVAGFVLPCPTHTYTVTSGMFRIVSHESVDARGINHFTETETPNHVSLVDEHGNVYSMRGAIWFGGRADQILTATHMLNIVGPGGVSDSVKLVERFRFRQLISRGFGTC